MTGPLSHPRLLNNFQSELAIANSAASEVRAKANPVFVWLVANHADKLPLKTLSQCTNFKPTPGLNGKTSHWTSAPGSAEQCTVLVFGHDTKSNVMAWASNAIPKPAPTAETAKPASAADFAAARGPEALRKLLHQVVSNAASKEHMDWVERVYTEGQRYRTSPIFLVVLDGEKQYFYATTALIQGPQQVDRSLEWTGRVSA